MVVAMVTLSLLGLMTVKTIDRSGSPSVPAGDPAATEDWSGSPSVPAGDPAATEGDGDRLGCTKAANSRRRCVTASCLKVSWSMASMTASMSVISSSLSW